MRPAVLEGEVEHFIPSPTRGSVIQIWSGVLSVQRWQKAKFACSSKSVVARDMAQLCKERLAIINAGADELTQSALSTGTRREVAAADRQRSQHEQPLIVIRKRANVLS